MNPLLVNVAELLRRPGNEKQVEAVLTAEELALSDPRVAPDAEVAVSARLASMADGILVTARLSVPWHDTCRRCLAELDEAVDTTVHELYQVLVTAEDAFPIIGEQIDLTLMVRESILLELPLAPLCRADCAGICPTCGENRNDHPCSCEAVVSDDRWSALDALREQLN
jgi:DUF177 domain-containing protein